MSMPKFSRPDYLVPAFPEGMYRLDWLADQIPVLISGSSRSPLVQWHGQQRIIQHPDPVVPLDELAEAFGGQLFVSVVVIREKEDVGSTPHEPEYRFVDRWRWFFVGRFTDPFVRNEFFTGVDALANVCRVDTERDSEIAFHCGPIPDEGCGAQVFFRHGMEPYFDPSYKGSLTFLYVGEDAVKKALSEAFRLLDGSDYWAPGQDTLLRLIDAAGLVR